MDFYDLAMTGSPSADLERTMPQLVTCRRHQRRYERKAGPGCTGGSEPTEIPP